jgi:phosphatidate cytidylyltransferase
LHLLKRVLTAVVLIPIVLLLVLEAPITVLAAVAALVALLAVQELLRLGEGYGIRPLHWPTYIFVALFFLFLAVSGSEVPLLAAGAFIYLGGLAAAFAPFVFLAIAMRRADLSSAFPAAMLSVFAFVYVALPLGLLVEIRELWAGAFLVMSLMLVVWAGDVFAYFVGRALGHHFMSPRISPKKTWEGALASLLASVGVAALLYQYALPISSALLHLHVISRRDGFFALQRPPLLLPTLLLAAAVNVAAQLGDLVESLIKRGAGAKDSGAILPGHGGMLDRIDALLFAIPVLWYYAAWRVMQ